MSIPSGVARFVLVGHLGGSETFETGFWEVGDFASQANVDDAAAAAATAFLADMASAATNMLRTIDGYDEVRVYGYPSGGPTASFVGVAPLGTTGSSSTSNPLQTCCVATLLTGAAGRRRRGRMYLPATGEPLTASEFSSARVTAIANAVAGFLGFGSPDPTHGPIVLSQVAGTHAPVTQVRVDSKPDIQRRRAESLSPAASHVSNV